MTRFFEGFAFGSDSSMSVLSKVGVCRGAREKAVLSSGVRGGAS